MHPKENTLKSAFENTFSSFFSLVLQAGEFQAFLHIAMQTLKRYQDIMLEENENNILFLNIHCGYKGQYKQ